MRNRSLLLGASLLLMTTLSLAQVEEIARQLGLGSKLTDTKISSGLKQALQIGAEQSVKLTGRPDGYFGNPDIKILMPNNLRTLEKGLRMVGYGPKVDDFVLSMNRAAEAAAPAARQIFIDAITAMTIDDARGILSGGDTAATEMTHAAFFREETPPPPATAKARPRPSSPPPSDRWWNAAWLETASSDNTTSSRRSTNQFHSPKIRTWTSAITCCPRLWMDSFTNWARKSARSAKTQRRRPRTCCGKYSGAGECGADTLVRRL